MRRAAAEAGRTRTRTYCMHGKMDVKTGSGLAARWGPYFGWDCDLVFRSPRSA